VKCFYPLLLYLLNKQEQSNEKRFYRKDAKGAEDNIFVFRPLSEKQKEKFLCVLRASAVKTGLRRIITLIFEL